MQPRLLLLLLLPAVAWSALLTGTPAVRMHAAPRTRPATMAQVKLTNGAKSVKVGENSSLMAACKKLGLNVKTNCKKGDCGTCTVNVGGRSLRACIGKVPPAPKLKCAAPGPSSSQLACVLSLATRALHGTVPQNNRLLSCIFPLHSAPARVRSLCAQVSAREGHSGPALICPASIRCCSREAPPYIWHPR